MSVTDRSPDDVQRELSELDEAIELALTEAAQLDLAGQRNEAQTLRTIADSLSLKREKLAGNDVEP